MVPILAVKNPVFRLGLAAGSLVAFLIGESALACQFDTDCGPGSRCVKEYGRLDGACVGGLYPGVDHQAGREAAVAESNRQTLDGISNTADGVGRIANLLSGGSYISTTVAFKLREQLGPSATQEQLESLEWRTNPALGRLFSAITGSPKIFPRDANGNILPAGVQPASPATAAKTLASEAELRSAYYQSQGLLPVPPAVDTLMRALPPDELAKPLEGIGVAGDRAALIALAKQRHLSGNLAGAEVCLRAAFSTKGGSLSVPLREIDDEEEYRSSMSIEEFRCFGGDPERAIEEQNVDAELQRSLAEFRKLAPADERAIDYEEE